ncbi:hypothetical protein G6O69_30665 [Pseudenhygromyxa sp. WMMC2535]|uniref:hypothetical protein n=1 Tax=Pseudenhygromyxa sp. WMMC2535 TaxID=2712867 RepID=UPI0015571515|nr:hypothetical protein [Pseudenhygromyxa sp. WMMC2535]NVB42226.1 hypothetical protein [Pseudenhygromyxa sp. WMMC2535]
MSAASERFLEALVELELDPELLRGDPSGRSWLPEAMLAMVESDEDCAFELREFVDMELELLELHEPSDAFFTRAVMGQLPEIEAVDDRRRNWILASAYALAIGVGYLLLGPALQSGELSSSLEPLRAWYESHALEAGGLWGAVVMLVIAGALVVLPTDMRRAGA